MSKKSPSSLPKHALDNRANQLNPNNEAYRTSRDLPDRPADGQPSPSHESSADSAQPPPGSKK